MQISPATRLSLGPVELTRITSAGVRPSGPDQQTAAAPESFQELLSAALHEVNQLQHEADRLSAQLALGELEDVSQALVAMEKAQLALELTVEVRNRLLEAYREIMRMPL